MPLSEPMSEPMTAAIVVAIVVAMAAGFLTLALASAGMALGNAGWTMSLAFACFWAELLNLIGQPEAFVLKFIFVFLFVLSLLSSLSSVSHLGSVP